MADLRCSLSEAFLSTALPVWYAKSRVKSSSFRRERLACCKDSEARLCQCPSTLYTATRHAILLHTHTCSSHFSPELAAATAGKSMAVSHSDCTKWNVSQPIVAEMQENGDSSGRAAWPPPPDFSLLRSSSCSTT